MDEVRHPDRAPEGQADRDTKTITLADLALEAGVSVSAVSLALSDKGKISEPVRERVKQIAVRLGYRGRATAQERKDLVGLVVEELPESAFSDFFFSRLIMGAESALASASLRPTICVIRDDSDRQSMLKDGHQQYAGLIVLGSGDLGEAFLGDLVRLATPVVLADTYLPDTPAFAVMADNLGGTLRVVEHLVGLGHRRIAMIRGSSKYRPLEERWLGYLGAMARNGLPVCPELVPKRRSHGPDKGYAEMVELLDLPEPPTAVFGCSDRTAIRAMDAIRERGLRIPEDIAVVGFDDFPEAAYHRPPLTSVKLPMAELGRFAAVRLIGLLQGKELQPYTSVLPTELIVRESSRGYWEGLRNE